MSYLIIDQIFIFENSFGGFQTTTFASTIKMTSMNSGNYIFSQLCQFLPRDYFEYLVSKYQGNKYVKSFTCWNHLMVMIWAQLTCRESLRDITNSLKGHKNKFHHLGFGKSVCRSTLSEANEKRELKIFQLFAERVIEMTQKKLSKVNDPLIDGLESRVFAIDSTTISLDLKQFWWSKVQKNSGGVKLHTILDLMTHIPVYNVITDNNVRDQSLMDIYPYEPHAFYVFDKAYLKLVALSDINETQAYFIVRRKKRMNFEILQEYNYPDPSNGVLRDLKIKLSNRWASTRYIHPIRIVYYYSTEKQCVLEFFTNNFELDAQLIAYLYKCRWQIEMFFKWIKQHLKIKRFYGISENAVKIQIYVAIITYCLTAIVGRELKLDISSFELMQILSVSLFEKKNLREFLIEDEFKQKYQFDSSRNLKLF